jgi:hypothetical protein
MNTEGRAGEHAHSSGRAQGHAQFLGQVQGLLSFRVRCRGHAQFLGQVQGTCSSFSPKDGQFGCMSIGQGGCGACPVAEAGAGGHAHSWVTRARGNMLSFRAEVQGACSFFSPKDEQFGYMSIGQGELVPESWTD